MTDRPTALEAAQRIIDKLSPAGSIGAPSSDELSVARAFIAAVSGPFVHDVQWIQKQAIERLTAERDRLREALKFYADPFNAKDEFGDLVVVPDFYSELDFGARAVAALAKVTP